MRVYRLLCAVLILILLVPAAGGGCADCEGYRLLHVQEGIAHFSLEYSCNWKVTIVDTRDIYTDVGLIGPTLKVDDSKVPSGVCLVYVKEPSEETPNASAAQDDYLAYLANREDVNILEYSSAIVAGLEAKQVKFHHNIPTDPVRVKDPVPAIARLLYFDYAGLIWEIYTSSTLSTAEENEVHFNHILEAFKILD